MGMGMSMNSIMKIVKRSVLLHDYPCLVENAGYTPDIVAGCNMELKNGASIDNGLVLNGGNQQGIVNTCILNGEEYFETELNIKITSFDGYDWILDYYYNTSNRLGIIAKNNTFIFYSVNGNKSLIVDIGTMQLNYNYKIKFGIKEGNIAYLEVNGLENNMTFPVNYSSLVGGYLVIGNYRLNGGSNYNAKAIYTNLKIK